MTEDWTPLERLGRTVRAVQDSELDPRDRELTDVRRRLLEAPRSRWRASVSLVAAVALLGWFIGWFAGRADVAGVDALSDRDGSGQYAPRTARSNDVAVVEGEVIGAVAGTERSIWFPDGSSILVRSSSTLRVDELQRSSVTVTLEQGDAAVALSSDSEARYLVRAGPYMMRSRGARFDVQWDATEAKLTIVVADGTLLVEGPGVEKERLVVAGQTVVLDQAPGR